MTQRGNHRQRVFFTRGDRAAYLSLLREHAATNSVEVVAYCLMPNHVHIVAVPADPAGLHCLFKAVHGQYAQRVNRMREQKGHLWQGRYFSSPLDSDYFSKAVRYVELNPVRAKLVAKAEDYEWSSAAAHCGLCSDPVVESQPRSTILAGIVNWSRWLSAGIVDESIEMLRNHGGQNLPCGSDEFIARLEKTAERELRYRPRGGQPKPHAAANEGERPLRKTLKGR